MISKKTTEPTPETHARNAVVEDKGIGCRDLGVVDCKHCRAAEYGVVAELTDGHAVAVWIPKTSAAHVDTFTFLLAHNHLNKGETFVSWKKFSTTRIRDQSAIELQKFGCRRTAYLYDHFVARDVELLEQLRLYRLRQLLGQCSDLIHRVHFSLQFFLQHFVYHRLRLLRLEALPKLQRMFRRAPPGTSACHGPQNANGALLLCACCSRQVCTLLT